MPSDLVIMRRVEPAIVDGAAHWLVHIADQAAVEGEAGEDRQITLGDAESLVDLPRIAPFRDDMSAAQKQPVRPAARPHRPQHRVPRRFFLKLTRILDFKIAAPFDLAFRGMARRSGEGAGRALVPD